ncbi:phospholipid-transporting ATPase VA-like [Plectropomus leopardus]|uniref:phospholipid-transporting ATPase VA-like n=1 Tax=Plectropomus leopardus TaxID=160734 RepID=UPI001C4A8B2F|nr:phospholipid-transporting ATPase VA-like [Plectropomus leopardus]
MQRLLQDPLFYLLCVITPVAALLPRYFYRACQGTLFPSPVQVGRQLDKLPSETRRNILSLRRVKVGSPLSPTPPFLSLSKPSPKGCNKKDQRSFPGSETSQGPILQTEQGQRSPQGPTDSERGLSDHYTSAPTEKDTLPFTTDAPKLSGEPQPPSTKDSECLDKTLEAADLSLSSWITSTPLLPHTDSVQLNLPPDGDSQCVRYTRNSEERLQSDHSVHPRTERASEQSLHTAL